MSATLEPSSMPLDARRRHGLRSACDAVVTRMRRPATPCDCVLVLGEGSDSVDVHVDTLRIVDGRDGWLTWTVDLETATAGRHRTRFGFYNGPAPDGARVQAAAVLSGRGAARRGDAWGTCAGPVLRDAIERAVAGGAERLSRLRFTTQDGELRVLEADGSRSSG